MPSFEEIAATVQRFHQKLVSYDDLERYFDSIKSDCHRWKTNKVDYTEFMSTWRVKSAYIIPEPFVQKDTKDNCWSIAISRGQNALVKLNGSSRPLLEEKVLLDGVDHRYKTKDQGILRLEDVIPFMEKGGYVKRMVVHHRPRGKNQAEHDAFEALIERLLVKGAVVVAFDFFPSYGEFSGNGIYCPTEVELQRSAYERFPRRCVMLSGKGVEVHGSEIKEFWEGQESEGDEYGDEGFIRLARRKYLIREIVELTVSR